MHTTVHECSPEKIGWLGILENAGEDPCEANKAGGEFC
jgi:hypothetical protein